MTWRQRFRARRRRRLLGKVFPQHRTSINDPSYELLMVAVPVSKRLLDGPTEIARAAVATHVGQLASVAAMSATNKRTLARRPHAGA